MDVVVIPAYKPDDEMLKLVKELRANNLSILIVDDGSPIAFYELFDKAGEYAKVIHSAANEGKGAALKHGFEGVKKHFPECENIITADADGQHKVADILRVVNELHNGSSFVLTVRDFGKNKIPTRSRIGNDLSRWVYATATGHYFIDNQSGLRGFSSKHIDWLLKVEGDKYDYEMNMLYYADKQSVQITTLKIDAIYIDGNKSSHFNPVKDTVRIYKRLFSSMWPTFASLGMLEIGVLIIGFLFGYEFILITLPSICISSAVICVIFNRFIRFRRVRYADGTRTIVHATLRTIIYTMACLNIGLYSKIIPLAVSFNAVALLLIPLEYLLHKIMHLNKYRDINKER